MDPWERQFRRNIKPDAIIAFVLASVGAYLVQSFFTEGLPLRGNGLFTLLIVAALGGLWYRIRNVV